MLVGQVSTLNGTAGNFTFEIYVEEPFVELALETAGPPEEEVEEIAEDVDDPVDLPADDAEAKEVEEAEEEITTEAEEEEVEEEVEEEEEAPEEVATTAEVPIIKLATVKE